MAAVVRHLRRISEGPHRLFETDNGEPIVDRDGIERLLENWNLELDMLGERRPYLTRYWSGARCLVLKIVFSMPAGTPPLKLRAAVRSFLQEEFSLRHRYITVLRTDEPNPHVQAVVKALSEEDFKRPRISPSTLWAWRNRFVHHLRAQGVIAKATRRTVRAPRNPGTWKGMQRPTSRRLGREESVSASLEGVWPESV
jgi:hypothetical protein